MINTGTHSPWNKGEALAFLAGRSKCARSALLRRIGLYDPSHVCRPIIEGYVGYMPTSEGSLFGTPQAAGVPPCQIQCGQNGHPETSCSHKQAERFLLDLRMRGRLIELCQAAGVSSRFVVETAEQIRESVRRPKWCLAEEDPPATAIERLLGFLVDLPPGPSIPVRIPLIVIADSGDPDHRFR